MLFFKEIDEFRTAVLDIKNILSEIKTKQQEICLEIEHIRKINEQNMKKFKACHEAFDQTKIVCEELTERICDASGVISNL